MLSRVFPGDVFSVDTVDEVACLGHKDPGEHWLEAMLEAGGQSEERETLGRGGEKPSLIRLCPCPGVIQTMRSRKPNF